MLTLILVLAAFIVFVIEAWWHKSLIAAGLALWILAIELLPRVHG